MAWYHRYIIKVANFFFWHRVKAPLSITYHTVISLLWGIPVTLLVWLPMLGRWDYQTLNLESSSRDASSLGTAQLRSPSPSPHTLKLAKSSPQVDIWRKEKCKAEGRIHQTMWASGRSGNSSTYQAWEDFQKQHGSYANMLQQRNEENDKMIKQQNEMKRETAFKETNQGPKYY